MTFRHTFGAIVSVLMIGSTALAADCGAGFSQSSLVSDIQEWAEVFYPPLAGGLPLRF